MPVTNYSKWEAMDFDRDSDEEEDKPRKPRVTKLEGPSRITLGAPEPSAAAMALQTVSGPSGGSGSGSLMTASTSNMPKPAAESLATSYSKWDHFKDDDEDLSSEEEEENDAIHSDDDAEGRGVLKEPAQAALASGGLEGDEEDALDEDEHKRLREMMSAAGVPPAAMPDAPPVVADPTALFEARRKALTRNGAAREAYLWRQTEKEVELCVLVPAGTRARELRPELRESDLLLHTRQMLVVHRAGGGGAFFEGSLAYPVAQPDTAEELTWELSDYEPGPTGRRLLHVTLLKEAPDCVRNIWWERALVGEDTLDTTVLPDRKWAEKLAAQQSTWQQAQQMFRDKVAQRQRVPIEIDMTQAADD